MKDWFKKLYTRFFAWVARIPHDKLLHFAFGATLTAILAMFPFELTRNAGFFLVILISILKEGADDFVNGKGSGDVYDVFAAGAGALLVAVAVYLTEYVPF